MDCKNFSLMLTPVNALHLTTNGVSWLSCLLSFLVGYGVSYNQWHVGFDELGVPGTALNA